MEPSAINKRDSTNRNMFPAHTSATKAICEILSKPTVTIPD